MYILTLPQAAGKKFKKNPPNMYCINLALHITAYSLTSPPLSDPFPEVPGPRANYLNGQPFHFTRSDHKLGSRWIGRQGPYLRYTGIPDQGNKHSYVCSPRH